MEALESRTMLAATFAPQPFTDPFPTPFTQGQSVVTPAWAQSFDSAATFGSGNLVSGVIGTAWSGYASGAYPSFATPAALQGAKSAMTIEFWARGGTTSSLLTGPGFSVYGQPNGTGTIFVNFTMARDGVFVGGAPALIPLTGDTNWHHYAVANDCQYLSAYRDGELFERHWIGNTSNQIGPMTDGTNSVLSPNLQFGPSSSVDELRLYNVALSPSQVQQSFENYRAYPTTLYASPTGSGAGTSASPMSLATALSQVGPDTKIILQAGTYDGSLFQLSNKGGSQPLHQALIIGDPSGGPVIISTTGSVGPRISGGGFLTLRHLQFVNNATASASALTITGLASPVLLDSCQISSDTAGVLVNASSGVTVQNCVIQAATTGLGFTGSPHAIVRNNTIRGGTTGISFTSTSNYLALVANLLASQSTTSLLIDASSAAHTVNGTATGDYIADSNAYAPSAGAAFASFNGTTYSTAQFAAYQIAVYRLRFPGDTGQQSSRAPELRSFVTSPSFNSTNTASLDLRLQHAWGNPIDAATFSTLSDFAVPMEIEPALYDATGMRRPAANPLDIQSETGGNLLDPGAYEQAAPSQFTFNLPAAASTSAGVYKADGTLVRTLWSGRRLLAGNNTAYWNGLDDNFRVMSVGDYTVKVLSNNIVYTYAGLVGNSSTNINGPTELRVFFSDPNSMAVVPGGTTAYMAMGYQEALSPVWKMDISVPNQIQSKMLFHGGTSSKQITDVATDGTRVYFVSSLPTTQGTPNAGFVSAWNVSSDTQVAGANWGLIDGGPYYGIKVGNPGPIAGRIQIQGVAVQYNAGGNVLFVSVQGDNKIYMFDKTSGAATGSINVTSPGDICVDATGNLWAISGTSLLRFSASNNWAAAVQTIAGLAGPVALGYSSFAYGQSGSTGTILVADGGTSQQVKAYRTDTGANLWVYGQAGGYGNGPAVTNDKFEFGTYYNYNTYGYIPATFLTALSDGSFWIFDYATQRAMKFDSTRAYQATDTMEVRAGDSSVSVDPNNPNHVYADWIEFAVDYTKPFAYNNGSWTPLNYYGHDLPRINYGFAGGLQMVTTLSNGRTYGISRGSQHFVELTASGIRDTNISTSNYATGTPWLLQSDGSLTTTSPTSPTGTVYRRVLTGFDGSGNPQWAAATVIGSAPYTSSALAQSPMYVEGRLDTASNLTITYNPGNTGGFHLGAIATNGTDWLWKTIPSDHLDGRGAWDSNGAYAGADRLAGIVGHDIFVVYRGEFWNGVQANTIMHYNDDGLFVGQFGQPSILKEDKYASAIPLHSTNMSITSVVSVGGKHYLFTNDESGHGGINVFRVDGLSTEAEIIGTLTLAVIPPATPSGLSATVASSSQINLSWTDNSNNENGFKVERATDSGFTQNLTLVTTTAANATSYSNTGLSLGTTYHYRVRATNAAGDSANSAAASATTTNVVAGATITYSGYEIATALSGTWQAGNRVGFRTTGTGYTKAYDPDGDNVYGSDGYIVYLAGSTMTSGTFASNGLQVSNPTSYISSVNVSATAGTVSSAGAGFGNLDNPTLSPGSSVADVNVGSLLKQFGGGDATNAISDFLNIVVSSAKTFTIGIESLNGDHQKPLALILGGVTATRAQSQYLQSYGNPDWYFFTVTTTGPQTITLQVQRDGTNPQSGINAITFDSAVPAAPTAPSGLNAMVFSPTQINLAWTDNSANETGFKIERATDSGFTQNLTLVTTTAANATSYSNTGLAANTTYYYRVRATNAAGDSANSNTAGPMMPLLQINGDQGSAGQSDQIRVARNATDSSLLDVFLNSVTPTYSVTYASLYAVSINGLGGDDTLTLDLANGPVIPTGGISYDGGTQTTGDSLITAGSSGDDAVTFLANQVTIGAGGAGGAGVVTLTSVEKRSFQGGAGNDSLALGAGSYTFASDLGQDTTHLSLSLADGAQVAFSGVQHLGSLSLSGSAKVTLADGGRSTLVVQSLVLGATSSLDVADNAVIVDYSGSSPLAAIYPLVANSAGNHWAGSGIVSHTAAAAGSEYAVGVADNSTTRLASFAGQTVDETSVLIRFTYSGDANLDGQVDLTDLSILAGSWQMAGRQWSQGNADYSGLVDLTDLSLLASNWQKVLPAPVAAEVVSVASAAVVSQPVDAAATAGAAVADPAPADPALAGDDAVMADPLLTETTSAATTMIPTTEAEAIEAAVAPPADPAPVQTASLAVTTVASPAVGLSDVSAATPIEPTSTLPALAAAPAVVTKPSRHPPRKTATPAHLSAHPIAVSLPPADGRVAGVFSNRQLAVSSALAPWPITSRGTRTLLGSEGRILPAADEVLGTDVYSRRKWGSFSNPKMGGQSAGRAIQR